MGVHVVPRKPPAEGPEQRGQHCFPVLPFIWLSGSFTVNYSHFEPTFKLFDKYLMKYSCAKTVCIFITKVCFFFAGADGVIPAQVS